jgi:hypothetical protein
MIPIVVESPILGEGVVVYEEPRKPGEIKKRIFGFLDSWFPDFICFGGFPGCFLWDF